MRLKASNFRCSGPFLQIVADLIFFWYATSFSILVILKHLKGLRRIAETSLCHLCMLIMLFLLFPWNLVVVGQIASLWFMNQFWSCWRKTTRCRESYCFSIVSASCRVITGVTMVVWWHLWSPGLRFLSQLCEGSRGRHKQGRRRNSHSGPVGSSILRHPVLKFGSCFFHHTVWNSHPTRVINPNIKRWSYPKYTLYDTL